MYASAAKPGAHTTQRHKFTVAKGIEVKPKEEKKKAAPAEKPLKLPNGGPPPLYQRIVVTEADGKTSVRVYPTTEQLRELTKNLAPETKLERIFDSPQGVHASFRINVASWRKLVALEEARGDGIFLKPEEAG